MPRSAPRHAGNTGSLGAYAFVAGGVVAGLVYALNVSDVWSGIAFAAVGFGTVIALAIGPGWQHVDPRRPWTLLSAASALFLVGALARQWLDGGGGLLPLASDLFTLPGYVL